MASKKQRRTETTINSLRASFYQLDLSKQKALIEALRKQPIVRKNVAYQLFLEECTAYYAQGVFEKQEQDRLKRQEADAARLRAIESLKATKNIRQKNPGNRRIGGSYDKPRPITTPPKELGTCTACGREKIADMIFCIFCAHKYESPANIIEPDPKPDLCENCGTEKTPGNKFCPDCGQKLI